MSRDTVISESLRLYGEWAQREIEICAHFIHPEAVVADVGAFIGTHARAYSQLVGPSGKVFAFEPRESAARVLEQNTKLGPFQNISVIRSALGAERKVILARSIVADEDDNVGAATLAPVKDKADSGESLAIMPLDDYKLARIDFLKVDVEGMEFDVLTGGRDTIDRCRPVIHAECNSLQDAAAILDWASGSKYAVYGALSPAFNEENFAGNAVNIFGAAKEAGLLLLPRESRSSHQAFLRKQCLPRMETLDDLALLLLHKPQYPQEVLSLTRAARFLSLLYPSPLAERLREEIGERDGVIAAARADLDEVENLRSAFSAAEELSFQRLSQLQALNDVNGELEALSVQRLAEIERLAADLDKANEVALSRMEEIQALATQLRTTAAAQASAERDALSRLDELQALTTQLQATEAAQASAERDALSRLDALHALTAQLKATEAAQASAERDALSRLDALQALTAQLKATEAAQASAERDAFSRLDALQALTAELKASQAAQASAELDALSRLEVLQARTAQLKAAEAAQASAERDAFSRLDALQALTAQLTASQAAQASAERNASSRRDEVEALTKQLKAAQAALTDAITLAGDRLNEIGALGEARVALQSTLDDAQQRIRQLESDLQSTQLALQETIDHRDGIAVELAEIHCSFGWRWLKRFRALQHRVTRKPR